MPSHESNTLTNAQDADPLSSSQSSLSSSKSTTHEPRFSLIGWVREVLGVKREYSLREALEEVLEEHSEDGMGVDQEEKALFENMLHFSETTVSDIMIPLPDMVAIEYTEDFEAVKQLVISCNHTRIPVYKDTIDHIMGFLHTKDLLAVMSSAHIFEMETVLRNLLFVPPSMRVLDLLVEMKKAHVHMAIVVDEFGGTCGLVTLEDVFEEIVGEIQDEHDAEEELAHLRFSPAGVLELDAKIRIDELEDALSITIRPETDDESYDTLGGLAFYHFGYVPHVGETLALESGYRLIVQDADARRIKRVRLIKPKLAI